jgi:hypothetical protein
MVSEPLEQQVQVLPVSGRVDHNFIEVYDEVGEATRQQVMASMRQWKPVGALANPWGLAIHWN